MLGGGSSYGIECMPNLKNDLEQVDTAEIPGLDGVCYKLIDESVVRLDLKTKAAKEFLRVAMANALLMDRKQIDYGPHNIADFGTTGVVMRLNDKIQRVKNLHKGGRRRKAQNESLMDSFRDISNYGIIAMMLELDRWPLE